jgi:hypothetical protein
MNASINLQVEFAPDRRGIRFYGVSGNRDTNGRADPTQQPSEPLGLPHWGLKPCTKFHYKVRDPRQCLANASPVLGF